MAHGYDNSDIALASESVTNSDAKLAACMAAYITAAMIELWADGREATKAAIASGLSTHLRHIQELHRLNAFIEANWQTAFNAAKLIAVSSKLNIPKGSAQ